MNVPNVITFARILSTPYLAYLIVDGSYTSAIGGTVQSFYSIDVSIQLNISVALVLAVAGFSDWLDGYIARTYKQEVRTLLLPTCLCAWECTNTTPRSPLSAPFWILSRTSS